MQPHGAPYDRSALGPLAAPAPSALFTGQPAFIYLSGALTLLGVTFLPVGHLLTPIGLLSIVSFALVNVSLAVAMLLGWQFSRTRSVTMSVDNVLRTNLTAKNLTRSLAAILLVKAFLLIFTSLKFHLPNINPFWADKLLADADRWLHFGYTPWRIIDSIYAYGFFTRMTDLAYGIWFPVVFGSAAAAALATGNDRLRNQFLLAFVASWAVIGGLFAALFSSVGPIFFDLRYGGQSEFTQLVANLKDMNAVSPLGAVKTSELLWQSYTERGEGIIRGISAMPSMHVAMCVLIYLAARHVHKRLAFAAGLFCGVIFAGSVHLGWHYAVDGYAAAALTALIWRLSGWIAERETQAKAVSSEASAEAAAASLGVRL